MTEARHRSSQPSLQPRAMVDASLARNRSLIAFCHGCDRGLHLDVGFAGAPTSVVVVFSCAMHDGEDNL